jgi:hypothetical protein
MAPFEIASLLGLLTSAVLSTLVCLAFRRALDRMLNDVGSRNERTQFSEGRVQFWVTYTCLLFIFLPAIGVLLSRPSAATERTILSMWLEQLLWCLVGMVVALFCTALGVGIFINSIAQTIEVSHDQVDDLKRLLERVEEIRARDIIRRAN